MKKLFLMFAAVGVLFTACNKETDCGHEFIEHDFSKDLVGTWTYVADNGQAEAMVIKDDGSFTTTGIMKGGALYEEKGTIKVVNNKVTLAFDGDNDTFEGRLEFVAGKSMSFVMFDDNDVRLTYDYCENDLSDEIVGMWVCNDGLTDGVTIMSYSANGKSTITTSTALGSDEPLVKEESDYVVVGDLVFTTLNTANVEGQPIYTVACMTYMPNGTSAGDIMTHKMYIPFGSELKESITSFLRIKQNLNLAERTYDYISAYVTNAKGKDEDFTILGNTFNISKIKSYDLDMMFRSILSCIELNENTIKFTFNNNGRESVYNDPITVDGNKVTVDMSTENPACRKVEMYMFQDADDSQLHIYMPTKSFINYFANLQIPTLKAEGKLDTNDDAAVEKVFADMEARIENINVSLILKARK